MSFIILNTNLMYPIKIKEKYIPNKLQELSYRFSTPYMGNYIAGNYNEFSGSHPGVDIVPEYSAQEVLAPLDGVIYKVGEDGAYGKYIFIEHKGVPDPDNFSKTTTLYSCFEHLSHIGVQVGQKVNEGDIIGNTGNTGNSYGEHLHFQIDRIEAPYHAYWPFTGEEARQAGTNFTGGVNIKLGYEKALLYTINPLVYLDQVDIWREKSKDNITNNTQNQISPQLQEHKKEEKEVLATQKEEDMIIKYTSPNYIQDKQEEISKNIQEVPKKTISTQEQKLEIQKDDNILISNSVLENFGDIQNSQKKKLKDIKADDPLYIYIHKLYDRGLISGFEDETFRPNASITRTEFLKFLFSISQTELSTDETSYFNDLHIGWYKKYVNTAVGLGLVSLSNKKFSPNNPISRVEALKIIILFFYGNIEENYNSHIGDINGDEWYAKYVDYALKNNFLSLSQNNFFPNKNITRYEVINILSKIIPY